MQPNQFFQVASGLTPCTDDVVKLKDTLRIRHLVAFPTSFDFSELENVLCDNPLKHGSYHGVGITSSGCFTVRKDIYHYNSPSIFELQGGRTDYGRIVPQAQLGYLEVHVFSVPFRCMTYLDNEFCNGYANNRAEFHVSLYSDKHKDHYVKPWIYIASQQDVPEKYINILDAVEGDFYRVNKNKGFRKVYK